jgi:3-hydroxybutyryl-CoA dehydrogenase
MKRIAVIGSGTMGHGIAQVCAMAGYTVSLYDVDAEALDGALSMVKANLEKGIAKGKVSPEERDSTLSNLSAVTDFEAAVSSADCVIEAIPEKLDWKVELFKRAEAVAPATCIFATNTSSLSVRAIAEPLRDPSRVIGTHFFNPVHIMALLEVIISKYTSEAVLNAIVAFGETIGKQVIRVQDAPGFATSRLGVCLGMEAIRMVAQGVASPEDIDKAMVLGYRHPIGPLKLTDMVGLDVRLAIGEYLSKELNNPAFEPPPLMREMVANGKLGKKSGQGFYTW